MENVKKLLKKEEKQAFLSCFLVLLLPLYKMSDKSMMNHRPNVRTYTLIRASLLSSLLYLHVVCSDKLWRRP